jgi:hypothetical protein
MLIENADQLYKMNNDLATDYLDALILRVYNGNQGDWFRNHFPVLLEVRNA